MKLPFKKEKDKGDTNHKEPIESLEDLKSGSETYYELKGSQESGLENLGEITDGTKIESEFNRNEEVYELISQSNEDLVLKSVRLIGQRNSQVALEFVSHPYSSDFENSIKLGGRQIKRVVFREGDLEDFISDNGVYRIPQADFEKMLDNYISKEGKLSVMGTRAFSEKMEIRTKVVEGGFFDED